MVEKMTLWCNLHSLRWNRWVAKCWWRWWPMVCAGCWEWGGARFQNPNSPEYRNGKMSKMKNFQNPSSPNTIWKKGGFGPHPPPFAHAYMMMMIMIVTMMMAKTMTMYDDRESSTGIQSGYFLDESIYRVCLIADCLTILYIFFLQLENNS